MMSKQDIARARERLGLPDPTKVEPEPKKMPEQALRYFGTGRAPIIETEPQR